MVCAQGKNGKNNTDGVGGAMRHQADRVQSIKFKWQEREN